MSDNERYRGKVPSNIDFDQIFVGVQGNTTRIRCLKESMVYFISLLIPTNYNEFKFKDGFRTINEKKLSGIIGKLRPSEVVKILVEKNVIQVQTYVKGVHSRRYRLTDQYLNVDFIEVEFSERVIKKLKEFYSKKDKEEETITLDDKYNHIFNQFDINKLRFDDRFQTFICELGKKLIEESVRIKQNNELTLTSIFNYVGLMVNIVNDIEEERFHLSVSPKNHRFNSNLTSLPKIIRPFLTINNQETGEVDISSSQSYILSTILNDTYLKTEENEFGLNFIFNELQVGLRNTKSSVPSNRKNNKNYILGVFLDDDNYHSLKEFTKIDFSKDFYTYLIDEGKKRNPELISSVKGFKQGRDFVKKHVMNLLFERNDYFREKNDVIKLIKYLYSGLCEFIEQFNQTYSNKDFSYLLQRTESFLMLEKVCRKIHLDHPSVPFYTIHDSIITTKENIDLVKRITSDTIKEITGKEVGIKTKIYEPSVNITDSVIIYTWNKVKITSVKQYESKKHTFLHDNIKKGIELLIEEDERNYWMEKMKCH